MVNFKPTLSLPNSMKQNWEYVKKLDDKINSPSAVAGGAIAERIKLSAKYRAQSEMIEHGTEAVLKNHAQTPVIGNVLNKIEQLDKLAKKASFGATAVTYEGLINHLRNGNSITSFDWKGLLKSRAWSHVEHTTSVAEGSAKALGRAAALNVAKAFILYDAVKDANLTFQQSRKEGNSTPVSLFKAAKTGGKEIGKSLVAWELGTFGSALSAVMLPGLGLLGAIGGGILMGGVGGYLLERYIPSPAKEAVPVQSELPNNPFKQYNN